MARLTRATQKIFAGNATNNGVFGSLQAGSGQLSNDVETIQSLPAYEQGWNAATISSELLPPLEEFQGVQYANSYQLAYNYQEGIPEWDSGTTYYIGSLVKVITSTGYQLYHSLTDNNMGNATSNQSYWELDFDSSNKYAFDQAVVHKEGNETITGYKTFTNGFSIFKGTGIFQNLTNTVADIAQKTTITDNTTEIRMLDKNDKIMAIFEHQQDNNGELRTIMAVRNHANSAWGNIFVGFDSNDNVYTNAPTPDLNSNTTEIATTQWGRLATSCPAWFSGKEATTQLTSGTIYYADRDLFVAVTVDKNTQGYIRVGKTSTITDDTNSFLVGYVVAPSTGGYQTLGCLIRKGLYFKVSHNYTAYKTYLMREAY